MKLGELGQYENFLLLVMVVILNQVNFLLIWYILEWGPQKTISAKFVSLKYILL